MEKLEEIKGIGPKTIELLNKLGINDQEELVTYFPFRYDYLYQTDLNSEKVITTATIESLPRVMYFNYKKNKMSFSIMAFNKVINATIFNRAYLKEYITIGKTLTLIGKYDVKTNTLVVSELKFKALTNSKEIEPVYHLSNGIKNITIQKLIKTSLNNKYESILLKDIENKYNFIDYNKALSIIHFPKNEEELEKAKERLIYEELFEFMFKINYITLSKKKAEGIKRNINEQNIFEFISKLPFKLTSDQLKSVLEILEDLNSSKTMNRLLQGDVGSGKTIVSIISIYINYLSGYMSALMAPTEILATQHYNNIIQYFNKEETVLLTGKTSKKEKEKIKEKISNGTAKIIIGTHSLITADLDYNNLGLVITDEQHRFGVNQRTSFKNKGNNPDILYMSATPIPRTYALTIYGDMDISNIKTMPSGRKEIKTILKKDSEMKEVLELMLEELKKKHQIYVVVPLVEENEELDMESVDEVFDKMNLAFSKYFTIGKIHGKMKSKEKEEIMEKFTNNEIHILVSTTVIEVGVDVKNATMIVIYDSYRFGLATLHQLRGRVGRNDLPSTCILISGKETKRLEILTKESNGFIISEEDFKLRGSGDLFGLRQSGDMKFKIADVKRDFDLLLKAKVDSLFVIKNKLFSKKIENVIKNLDQIS